MQYKEIIGLLQSSGLSVQDFAYEDIPCDSSNFSKKALKAQQAIEEWLKQNPKPSFRSEAYKNWTEEDKQFPSEYDIAIAEWKQDHNLIWEEVAQYGGEGQGDTWYSVKYFPNDDVYIKVSGYYTSYNGTSFDDWWDSCSEVKPIEKTITVYETKI